MTVDLSVPSQGRAHHSTQGTGLRTQAVSEFYISPVGQVLVLSLLNEETEAQSNKVGGLPKGTELGSGKT